MILYDQSCYDLAESFLRDSLPMEELGNETALKREAHFLAQVIQAAIEDHIKERTDLRWRVSGVERARWGKAP